MNDQPQAQPQAAPLPTAPTAPTAPPPPDALAFTLTDNVIQFAIQFNGKFVLNPKYTMQEACMTFIKAAVAPNRHLPSLDVNVNGRLMFIINLQTNTAALGQGAIADEIAVGFVNVMTQLLNELYPPIKQDAKPAPTTPTRTPPGKKPN